MTDKSKPDDASIEPSSVLSSGVQSLIDRLRDEGVATGKEEGKRIVADAEKRAEWLISQAKAEAEQIVAKAKEDATFIEHAGKDALVMAVRDSQIALKNYLTNAFAGQIEQLVAQSMGGSELLQKMIIEIAGTSRPEGQKAKLVLTSNEENHAALTAFVAEEAKQLLANGIDVSLVKGAESNIRLTLEQGGAEIVLSDYTVSRLILDHVRPRFKAMLEGIIN